jgi:hypothetical protein
LENELPSWDSTVELARKQPAFFLGNKERGHLIALSEACRIGWSGMFAEVREVRISISPTQYVVRAVGGPILPHIEQLAEWSERDLLVNAIMQVGMRVYLDPIGGGLGEAERFNNANLAMLASPLILADRGVVAVYHAEGLIGQGYCAGWPRTGPVAIPDAALPSFVVGAALPKEYFPGIPFVASDIERTFKHKRVAASSVVYYETDDLLPIGVESDEALLAEWVTRG